MTATNPPPIVVDLTWHGGMRFAARSDAAAFVLDGPGSSDPTPVQALAASLAACMGIDLVQVLTKGRHPLGALRAHLVGNRRGEAPKYFTDVTLHFVISGDVPPDAVERAIALSREKYCSVWHSLRQDLELRTTYEILEEDA
jgi:putative redox protein